MLRRPARLLLLGGLSAAVAVSAALAPGSQAASGVTGVKGGLTQAYQAVPYVKPAPPKVPSVR